jgi:FMN phosphatase YigB (HAD superfamily)
MKKKLIPKVLIFDLDDVLLYVNRTKILKDLLFTAWQKWFLYWIFNHHPKKTFFTFLESEFGQQAPVNPEDPPSSWLYAKHEDIILPKIICDHQKGFYTDEHIMEMIYPKIDTYFKSYREQYIMRSFVPLIFDSHLLTTYFRIFNDAPSFIERFTQQGHMLCILSNLSKTSFEIIFRRNDLQPVFKHFKEENCFISGNIGLMKPQEEIYMLVREKIVGLHKRLEDCIVIDDSPENIITAQKAGFSAILKDRTKNFTQLGQELEKHIISFS